MTDDGQSGVSVKVLHDGAVLTAMGAAVDAVYRAYLAAWGPNDEAVKDALRAAANRAELREEMDAYDATTAAGALEAAGMESVGRRLRSVAAHARAEELREQAAELEWEADQIEARA